MTAPQTLGLLGYSALRERAKLHCVRPRAESRLSTQARTVTRIVHADGSEAVLYPKGAYKERASITDHLEFALRYESLDLGVLAALFEQEEARESVQDWLRATPSSRYARLAGHLLEWLTGRALNFALPRGAPRVALLAPEK